MFKPWLKMWVEWLEDPEMLALTIAEQGAWWRLYTLAQKCAADGALVKNNSSPLSLDDIVYILRINKKERKVFDSMCRKMSAQNRLHMESETLIITHFAEEQSKFPSGTAEAVRERVKRHRERQKGVTENPLQGKEKESNKEKEKVRTSYRVQSTEEECNALQVVTSVAKNPEKRKKTDQKKSKTDQKKLKKVFGEAKNVLLTTEELEKLHQQFGVEGTEERINDLSLYKGSTGKKYASDYLTILNWERMNKSVVRGVKNGERKQEQSKSRTTRGFTVIESGGDEGSDL